MKDQTKSKFNQAENKSLEETDFSTERRQMEDALRASEAKYRLLSTNTLDTVWTTDLEFNVTFISNAVSTFLGYTSEELCGMNASEFMDPESITILESAAKELIDIYKEGEIRQSVSEVKQIRKDGTIIDVEITANLLQDGTGQIVGFQGRSTDITDRKKAESLRLKLEEELRQAQKMESVGRLAGGVAHDFNNMLSVILGHAELVLEQMGPDQQFFEDVQAIRSAARRSADLTRKLLAFARKETIAPSVLDINETVEGMLKMLRRLIGEDINLAWLPGRDLWQVLVDPSQIDHLLANLCVNARDAIAGVGKVTIETENTTIDESFCVDRAGFVPGEYVLLTVSDNGCGIAKDIMGNIFEPFFTLKDMDKGTGLGLATVYGIVKQNNGVIDVDSEPGQGAAFRIYLPRNVADATEMEKDVSSNLVARGHETILLVEDEVAILKMTTVMLERYGYSVLATSQPSEAIRLAGEHVGKIHLLVTDVIMPEMDGKNLARTLLSINPELKCLFMSGYTADMIALHGVLDEGVHFIQKPYTPQELAEKVRETLDS